MITMVLWGAGFVVLGISLKKDKMKTVRALKMSRNMMKKMIFNIISILLLIGLIQALLPPSLISKFLGVSNIYLSTFVSALVGSITLIPGFVAFPLVGSFIDIGVSIVPAVAFLTTLTMVGIATLPLEKETFGLKFTLYRNIYSFVFAIIIALIMGVIL